MAGIGFTLIVASMGIVGLQFYWYLQTGEWTSLSIIAALQIFQTPENAPWVFAPHSWDWTPSSLVVFFLGFLFLAASD
ncbi:hypothetical protein [Mesorhizobium sp.]|uniref:hypothetical protein n=1 Tax=Mesorhizobium sp. TaxID=1871066 RepID=UPI000FD5D746|nr:hypothetical protein [Mesorhizobium sp.]RVC64477.1 hypothetical protein EN779_01680 [Mesorhizobium sp. M4B.F.Ca.ET.088.02.2.1]RWF28347.1 MAG: hypothetical protein EOS45_22685 [Mesorhizobium sp.]